MYYVTYNYFLVEYIIIYTEFRNSILSFPVEDKLLCQYLICIEGKEIINLHRVKKLYRYYPMTKILHMALIVFDLRLSLSLTHFFYPTFKFKNKII